MKLRYAFIAVPVLVCGTAVAATSQASAQNVEPGGGGGGDAVMFIDVPGPTQVVAVDDGLAEALQTGAGAVGGAGLAVTGLWLYRRRSTLRTA
ncbi:hypothetical protein OHA70_29745 [Kribbella sp. NBC_00382]|uniref:hypothetical protein n=1 Tax=Kribbella sp. NBC_00382 TaxID=2975967 RepID=UPI002E1BA1BB